MGTPIVRPPVVRDTEDGFQGFQKATRTAIKTLDSAGLRKVTLKAVVLGATTVSVPHQLGKLPVGWIIIDKNAQADVWRDATVLTTAQTIPLKASATVTVDIQVW